MTSLIAPATLPAYRRSTRPARRWRLGNVTFVRQPGEEPMQGSITHGPRGRPKRLQLAADELLQVVPAYVSQVRHFAAGFQVGGEHSSALAVVL